MGCSTGNNNIEKIRLRDVKGIRGNIDQTKISANNENGARIPEQRIKHFRGYKKLKKDGTNETEASTRLNNY
jgi:hypothetical protein